MSALPVATKARSDDVFLAARFVEYVNAEKKPGREILVESSVSINPLVGRALVERNHFCDQSAVSWHDLKDEYL